MTNVFAKLSPRQTKVVTGVAAALILLTIIWLLIPTTTKWLANRYLSDYDATLTAEEINPDLFPIGLALTDVQITQQDQSTFSLDRLSIGLDFWPLFTGEFHVNHILVDNFDIQITQTPDGWNVAGVPLPQSTSSQQDNSEASQQQEDESLAPSFLITNARLKDIQVQLNTERGQDVLAVQNLAVEQASHFDANWQGTFNLKALVNDAEATVDGTVTADREQVDTQMTISSAALSTNDIEHFLPASRPQFSAKNVTLSGNLDALYQFTQTPMLSIKAPRLALATEQVSYTDKTQQMGWQTLETDLSDITATMDNETDLSASANNTLKISGLNIASDSQQLSADQLTFNAELAFNKQQSNVTLEPSGATLTAKTLKGSLSGHELATETLSIDLADTQANVDMQSSTGTIETQLTITGNALSGHLASGDQASLETILFTSPLELTLSERGTLVNAAKATLTLGETRYDSEQLNAALNGLSFNVEQLALQQQDQGLSVGTEQLGLAIQKPTFKSSSLEASLADVALQLNDTSVRQGNNELAISAQSDLALKQLQATFKALPNNQPNTNVAFDSLALNSQVSWQQSAQQSLLQTANNTLNLDQVQVTQDETLNALLERLSFQNDTAQVTLPQDASMTLSSTNNNLVLAPFDSHLADGSTLLSWQGITLSSSSANLLDNGPDAKVSSLSIDQLVASQPDEESGLPALATFEKLRIQDLRARPEGLEIDTVQFDKLKAGMVLSQERSIANLTLPKWLQTNADDASNDNTSTEASANSQTTDNDQPVAVPYHIIINRLSLSPESSALFTDNGISPSLTRVLDIEKLLVENFNTRDKDQPAHIVLKARNGNYATIDSDISIHPMAQNLTMKATAKVREVELPPVSPYVSSALGYSINSGHLNMDLNLEANQGELDGNTNIVLRQFELGGKKDSNALLKVGAVPLDLAVDALKNRDNEIVLDLPMSGNIQNPDFQWQNFFLLPIRQGLFKASSAYLMQTFVPYANVITLVQFAGEQALKLRVEPLQFALGEEDITAPEQEAFIDQMITLMKDRKGAQLRACGVSVVRDIDEDTPYDSLTNEQRNELLQLADERAETLKDYLVDNGIQSSRVFLCSPSIDDDNNALPRVTFSF